MKVLGLDGRTYSWPPLGHVPLGSEWAGSSYHERCRALLTTLFPNDQRLEEVPLPGSGRLRCDFLLPAKRMIVEVHGEQHYHFVLHFHRTRLGFIQAIARDSKKKEWCEVNGFLYLELPYSENDERWTERLLTGGKPVVQSNA